MRPRCCAVLLTLATTAAAQLKPPPLPQPAEWKPGEARRVFAQGTARLVRDFVWGDTTIFVQGAVRAGGEDHTFSDGADSKDRLLDAVAQVKVPADRTTYRIQFTRLATDGSDRPQMGGVLVDHDMFGNTEIGGPGLYPRTRALLAIWGYANVTAGGKQVARDRLGLIAAMQSVRNPTGQVLIRPAEHGTIVCLILFGHQGPEQKPVPGTRDGFLHVYWENPKVVTPAAGG